MIKNNIYTIQNNCLVQKNTNEIIPEDEPIFIFRARDRSALCLLVSFKMLLPINAFETRNFVQKIIDAFCEYKEQHPEKMQDLQEAY